METDNAVGNASEDTGGDADLSSDDSLGGLPFTSAEPIDDSDDDESFGIGDEDDAQPEAEGASQSSEPLTPEKILEAMAGQKAQAAKLAPEALAAINKLGAIWKGEPIQVKDEKELVDLVQKGFDYTRKSMERAEAEKAKDAEFAERETKWKQQVESFEKQKNEVAQQLQYFNLVDSVFRELEDTDPDMAETFAKMLRDKQRSLSAHNPIIEALNAKTGQLENTLTELAAQRTAEKHDGIRKGHEKELAEVQSKWGAQLAQLGIKPVWDKVTAAWSADAESKSSYEQAFLGAYGAEIVKAYESQQKVNQAKLKKSAAATAKSSAIAASAGRKPSAKYKPGDYDKILSGF